MARSRQFGSPSKEFPFSLIDETITAIRPGWTFADLRQFAENNTSGAIPAVLRKRYLLIDENDRIIYDRLLSLISSEPINSPRVRKVMYFTYFFRDSRLQKFICKLVANRHGIWRFNQLRNKNNFSFLERLGLAESTAIKVRSNIERNLLESGILDLDAQQIHLELEDGWLNDAIQVAAQHVAIPAARRAMVNAPMDYLITNQLNGLANATAATLLGYAPTSGPQPEPAEDYSIPQAAPGITEGSAWNRQQPTPAQQQAAPSIPDPVLKERASRAHYRLERITVDAARAHGHDPKFTSLIDVYFGPEGGRVLCEMKSCTEGNLRNQVRKGVSQLLEYRYLYRNILGTPTLLLVLEIKPSASQAWLIGYLESIGIILAWKDPGQDRLISTAGLPSSTAGVVTQISE